MAKIVQRVINQEFVPIKLGTLIEGTIIPFNCYIKRFGDYVIIIEAGTLITPNLYVKIQQNQTIYTQKNNLYNVKNYYAMHHEADTIDPIISSNDVIAAALNLGELTSSLPFEERLNAVYTTTSALMQHIFDSGNEVLPLDAISACVMQTVALMNVTADKTSSLLKMMPDVYTMHHHSTNVAFYSGILWKAIHNSLSEELVDVTYAGLMHDIGKIRIDQKILLKPTGLDNDEFELMKQHSDYSVLILKNNGITNQKVLDGVQYHHEKLDGSGYPQGLRGKLIPEFAQIIGICDIFDALTTERTFRKNYTSFNALLLLKRDMAAKFDEHHIDAFIRLLR